ncbi:MAG: sodium:calcium antiporter [Candidatus Pacearchaeota archaeon]|jgi:cation:H+ antiporter
MVIINLILLLICLFVLLKSADYATKYSSEAAKHCHISEFLISFFVVAFVVILPETTISFISAIQGHSELALGTLIGSNVADLTLIFGIIALFSFKGVKVKSKILKNTFFYLILLFLPLLLGIDGSFTRIDGAILLCAGILFFIKLYHDGKSLHKKTFHKNKESLFKVLILLILSLVILVITAYFTVKFGINFANEIHVPLILVGLTVIGVGSCLPELIFSIKAVRKNHNELALGDILGSVILDATVILGIVILISPFSVPALTEHITAFSMFFATFFVVLFMRTDHLLSKHEGIMLILAYILFLIVEFFVNKTYCF